ncbi:MAG: AAA family ATPase [Bacteroidales bacterium]|nr:AAA family ATPase [Bacteroidales bacterium]
MQQLRNWKENSAHKPLVIRGARQVGKTTLVEEFSKDFKYYIYLNLEKEEDAMVFAKFGKVEDIFEYLCLRNHIAKEPEKTLLFIDENQNEPKAVGLLRYFYENMPKLYVISAGSRLQALIKQHISFPVGRVEYMQLRPFSFMEYINAMEGSMWMSKIEDLSAHTILHDDLIKHFNKYALIGGMPEVIKNYKEHSDIERLNPIYKSLINGYYDDVEKYSKNENETKVIRHILNTGWLSAGEAISFNGFGNSKYSSTDIHEAMEILERAFVMRLCYPVTSTSAPAIPALKRSPKLIFVDTGLVNYCADIQVEFLQNKELLDTWRGRSAEHIVAQELMVLCDKLYKDNLNFWIRDKKGTTAETDFIWQYGTRMIPIEVKSGTNAHLKSIHSFMDCSEGANNLAIRIWSGDYSVNDVKTNQGNNFRLVNVPFYYIGVLDKIIKANL